MAHCAYALIIHFLWREKPFSVEVPTTRVISGEKMSAILAYMWMPSADSCPCSGQAVCSQPEFESLRFCPNMVDKKALSEAISFCHHSHDLGNSGEGLEGCNSSTSRGRSTIGTALCTGISASVDEKGSFYSVLHVNDYDAQRTQGTPLSDMATSEVLVVDDSAICECCSISILRGQQRATPR